MWSKLSITIVDSKYTTDIKRTIRYLTGSPYPISFIAMYYDGENTYNVVYRLLGYYYPLAAISGLQSATTRLLL